jgi:spore germination protein Q
LYSTLPWPSDPYAPSPTYPIAPITTQAYPPWPYPGIMQTVPKPHGPTGGGGIPVGPGGGVPGPSPGGVPVSPAANGAAGLPSEQSYVENILRMNLGKVATLYMTYENNSEWNAKVFKGVLEAAGRDHIIISDPATGKRFLLLTVNLDYITFDEPLNYTLPFGTAGTTAAGR